MMQAVLSNAQHPESGQINVHFPIPRKEYDQTIEALQAIDLGFSVNRDCTVNEIDSAYSVLGALKGSLVNVDQLDYLANWLDSFSETEASQFQAMAHKHRISITQAATHPKKLSRDLRTSAEVRGFFLPRSDSHGGPENPEVTGEV